MPSVPVPWQHASPATVAAVAVIIGATVLVWMGYLKPIIERFVPAQIKGQDNPVHNSAIWLCTVALSAGFMALAISWPTGYAYLAGGTMIASGTQGAYNAATRGTLGWALPPKPASPASRDTE